VVSPPFAAAPIAFWDNGETTVELRGSRPMASEECSLETSVVLAKQNKIRLLKNILNVFIVVIPSFVAYSSP
jgi:hypothetical protein